jgi:hypothetical protein
MKKFISLSIVMLSFLLTSFAQAAVKLGVAVDMDLSLVAQIDRYNIVLGGKGFAVDYLVKTGDFDNKAPLSWYFSGGGWAGWDHGFGVRAPVGVSWYFAKGWDLYGQVQPVVDLDNSFKLSVDGAIGVRYAF